MTPLLIIKRIEKSTDGVFGVLLVEGKAFCCTYELPDKGNERNISCIPKGLYTGMRGYKGNNNSPIISLFGVHGRDEILIHTGNTADDTSGCILVGERFGELNDRRGVLSSKMAFSKLIDAMGKCSAINILIEEV